MYNRNGSETMKFDEIQTSLKSKLGEEDISKISDDLANLITLN